jgi:hypothetical protein
LQPALFEMPPADVQPTERERVAQLLAANKSGQALDLAKDVHRRCQSAASEALLLDTYGARISSLVERKLDRDAAALMDLVRDRYPSSRERLSEWNAAFAARRGDLSALLAPLNDPAQPAEKQASIAANVRRDVFDLRALAECQTLSPEHPLRAAAAALYKALDAVTGGPVAEEALALPEVSRSSPLAPWKMAVRAIAAYYRGDDALCEKHLAAVEPDSAAARLVPALRALARPATYPAQILIPAAAALVTECRGNIDSLRDILKRLDSALVRRKQPLILQEIRNAVAACGLTDRGLLDRLKQHISIRALHAGLKPDKVAAAMDGPSLKNAYFWHLLARSYEENKGDPTAIGLACSYWEEFRKHAVREGMFPPKGPEAATLYLHMADQLRHVGLDDLYAIRGSFERHFDGHADFYRGQPPEIRALMSSRGNMDPYFLSADAVLERACEADPCAENFQRWLRYAEDASPETSDLVAERWSAALPKDLPPLLHLMQSAEKRNALQKAFKLVERAEQIDGLNADVRRARLRLLVSMAKRHLWDKKPKLAEKELRQIEALPQARQGDRPAFVAALRFVWCRLQNDRKEAESAYAEAVRFLGDGVTAQLLFLQVERWCGQANSALGKSPQPTVPLFSAFGRVCSLGDDMGMTVDIFESMPEQLMKELSAPNVSANPRALVALGEAAMRSNHDPLAYTIAGVGLAQGAESQARFLFLRARSLPPWEDGRCSSCLAAASELARRQHDSDLLKRIGEWRAEELDFLEVPEQAAAAPATEEIDRVVQREIQERAFPASRPSSRDGEECQCPSCLAERGELPRELMDMADQIGPDVLAQALAEMLGIGGKKKRGRRRSPLDDSDFPF